MPVKKTSSKTVFEAPRAKSVKVASEEMPSVNAPSPSCDCQPCDCSCTSWGGGFARKLLITFAGILLVYVIVFLGTLIRNELKKYDYIGMSDRSERTLLVEAEGKVMVTPDIAVTQMGMTTEADTVAEAQQKNTEVMNTLIMRLKELGISSEDIQTKNYFISPKYDYSNDEGTTLEGYQVLQDVSIKIRDLTKANQVLSLAGEVGATDVSGLEFTIDDRDVYVVQAREIALKKLSEKAAGLSRNLGVRLTEVVAYDEYEGGNDPYPMYSVAEGLGGADMMQVEPGTNEVVLHVSVTFGIR